MIDPIDPKDNQVQKLSRPPRPPTAHMQPPAPPTSNEHQPQPQSTDYQDHTAKQLIQPHSHVVNSEQLVKFFQQYKPESKFDMAALLQSDKLKLKRYKDCNYFGEFVNGKRHGKGVMIYQSGRLYQGNWESDLKHGEGFEKFSNGSQYTGSYINGKPQGFGTFKWPNGEVYEGQWVSGQKHGSGMWSGGRGDSYIGEWKFGMADGYGVHTWINGDKYEGEFKSCLKHGEGVEKFANGDRYSGSYVNGKPNGFGEYHWVNGSFFKGNFKNGLRHGHGIWKKGEGQSDQYQGEYVNDKKSGYGVFTWAGGNVYKGNYFEDLRHGYGEMYWSDGTSYKGQWSKGVQHGQGEVTENSGQSKKGVFKQNVVIIEQSQEETVQVNKSPIVETKNFRSRVSTSANKSRTLIQSQQKILALKQVKPPLPKPPMSAKNTRILNTTTQISVISRKSIQKAKIPRSGSLERNSISKQRQPCARCASKHSKEKCHEQAQKQKPQFYIRSSRLIRNSVKDISGSVNLNGSTTTKLSSINRKRLSMFQSTQAQSDSTQNLEAFQGKDLS